MSKSEEQTAQDDGVDDEEYIDREETWKQKVSGLFPEFRRHDNVRQLQKNGFHLVHKQEDGTNTSFFEDTLHVGDVKPRSYFESKGITLDTSKYSIFNMDSHEYPQDLCITRWEDCTWRILRNLAKTPRIYGNVPIETGHHIAVIDRRMLWNPWHFWERKKDIHDLEIFNRFLDFTAKKMVVRLWVPAHWATMDDKRITTRKARYIKEMMFLGYWYCDAMYNSEDYVPGRHLTHYVDEISVTGKPESEWPASRNQMMIVRPLYYKEGELEFQYQNKENAKVPACPLPECLLNRDFVSKPFVVNDAQEIGGTYQDRVKRYGSVNKCPVMGEWRRQTPSRPWWHEKVGQWLEKELEKQTAAKSET